MTAKQPTEADEHPGGAHSAEPSTAPERPVRVAHHFTSAEHQFASGKLGMWIFLATEILTFSGLFVIYAVYRANHPIMFDIGHRFLDRTWGATNTIILLLSSFTMAWAVRCAQRSQRRGLIVCLCFTLAGGAAFMGIKAIEYGEKLSHHLGPGMYYHPDAAALNHEYFGHPAHPEEHAAEGAPEPASAPVADSSGPYGLAQASEQLETLHPDRPGPYSQAQFDHIKPFFAIYFSLTGLHGLHVLIGMGLITWILIRSIAGHFNHVYYTPVDLVGLFWHLVDLIWIYLFPLLYLIQ